MSPLAFLLNILWLIFGGLAAALAWVIAAAIMAITIIGLPWAFAALRIALYTLLPFGHEMRSRPDAGMLSVLGNIIWFVLAGWWLAVIHLILAVQLLDRRGIVTELAQHLVGVLALVRGRAQLFGLREGAHMDRLADDVVGAELRVIDRAADAEMLDLWIGKD